MTTTRTRKTMKVYPSQIRRGDLLTIRDYTGHRQFEVQVEALSDAYEIERGFFTGHRQFELQVEPSYATLWNRTVKYWASERTTVQR